MSGLILGIDLCDSYTQISSFSPESMQTEPVLPGEGETSCLIPTVVCKKKGEDVWYIGAEAYQRALMGEGTLVDKLVNLLGRDGSATLDDIHFTAADLMTKFLEKLLALPMLKYNNRALESVAFSLQRLETRLMDRLTEVCGRIGISRDILRILSHTECFCYYVVSQPKEIWSNQVIAFDLKNAGLDYYEMKVVRGRKPQIIEAVHKPLDDSFNLDLLESPMGERMADNILSACAERMLRGKLISSVYLTGKGFTTAEWAPEFLKKVCSKRKVFLGQHLFSDGAAYIAYDSMQEQTAYPFVCICEGRIATTLSVYAVCGGRNEQLILASAGSNWYEARSNTEFILDDIHSLELLVTPYATQRVEKITIPLDDLPARPNKTTRIEVAISFESENRVTICIKDKGFGELFPSSGLVIRKDFLIS